MTFTRASAGPALAASGNGNGNGNGSSLACTGTQSTTPEAIAAGLVMLLGTALTVVARRRRQTRR